MNKYKDELDYFPTLSLWVKTMREMQETQRILYGLLAHAPESPLSRTIGNLQVAYTAAVAEITGLSEEHVLSPFWLENNMGKSPLKIQLKEDRAFREITDAVGLAKLAADWNAQGA